jgi:Fe-S-cluster-containing dehydrogenase component
MLVGLVTGAAATAVVAPSSSAQQHPAHPVAPSDAMAMLYDNNICTGCNACVVACGESNGLSPDTTLSGGLWQMPPDLNSKTRNLIKLYQQPDGKGSAFVKRQCMHCLDAACVSGCPFDALKKDKWGAVTWDSKRCIGCRYCQVVCPFDIPKFEWDRWNPRIVKCEFCFDQRLVENKQPACTAICPTGAVIFGKRAELLLVAKQRIARSPKSYFEKRVYGEHEGGGTQVLYLSRVAFELIGLPTLTSTSIAHYATKVTSVIYRWLCGPILLAGVLGTMIKENWDRHEMERPDREKETGVQDQL